MNFAHDESGGPMWNLNADIHPRVAAQIRFLQSEPLVQLGKYSYGIYVYHNDAT